MKKGTEHKLGKNLIISVFTQGLSFGMTFLLVPIYLRYWGAETYGHWVELMSIISYLSLVDLGGQIYVQNLLTQKFSKGEDEEFRLTLSRGVSFYLGVGCLALAIWGLLLVSGWFHPTPLLGRNLTKTEVGVLLLLGSNQFILSIPFGVFVTSYRARGLFSRAAWIGTITKLLLFFLSITALRSNGGLLALAAVQLCVGLISVSLLLIDSRTTMPSAFPLSLSIASARAGAGFVRSSFLTWSIAVGALLNQQGLILVLSLFGERQTVAALATHQNIANISTYVAGLVAGPILPQLAHLWYSERKSDFQLFWVKAVSGVTLTTGTVAICLYVGTPLFFSLWTSKQIHFDGTLLGLMLVQAVVGGGATAAGWSLLSTNHHGGYALASLANGLVTLLLAFVLAPKMGPVGLVGMSLVVDLVFAFALVPYIAARTLKLSARRIFQSIGISTIGLALFSLLAWSLTLMLPPHLRLCAAFPIVVFGCFMSYRLAHRVTPQQAEPL